MTIITDATRPFFPLHNIVQGEVVPPALAPSLEMIDRQLNQSEDLTETGQEKFFLALKTLSAATDEEIELALTHVTLPNFPYPPKDGFGAYMLGEDDADAWNEVAEALIQHPNKAVVLIGQCLLVAIRQEITRSEKHFLGDMLLDCLNAGKEGCEHLNRIGALKELRQLIFFPAEASSQTVDLCLQYVCQSHDGAFQRYLIHTLVDMGYKNHIFNHYADASPEASAALEGMVEAMLLKDAEGNSSKRKAALQADCTSYANAVKRRLKDANEPLTSYESTICKEAVCRAFSHDGSNTIMEFFNSPLTKHIVYGLFQDNSTPYSYFITMSGILLEAPEGGGNPALKQVLYDKLLEKAPQSGECLKMAYRLLQSFGIQDPNNWKKLLVTSEKTKWEKIKAEVSNAFVTSPPDLPEEDLFPCWDAIRYHGGGNGCLIDKAIQEAAKDDPCAHKKSLILLFEILEKYLLESAKKNSKVKHPTKVAEFKKTFESTFNKMVLSDTNIYLATRLINHKKFSFYFNKNEITAFATHIHNTRENQKYKGVFQNPNTSLELFATTWEDCILNKKIDLAELYSFAVPLNDRPLETQNERLAFIRIWSTLWEALLKKSLLNPKREPLFALIIDGLVNKCCQAQARPDETYNFILRASNDVVARKLINKKNFTDYFINISMLAAMMSNENDRFESYHAFVNRSIESKILAEDDAAFFFYLTLSNNPKKTSAPLETIVRAKNVLIATRRQCERKNITNKDFLDNFERQIQQAEEIIKNIETQLSYSSSTKELAEIIESSSTISDALFDTMKAKFALYTEDARDVWWVDDDTFPEYFSTVTHYADPSNLKKGFDQKNAVRMQDLSVVNITHFLTRLFNKWPQMTLDKDSDQKTCNAYTDFNKRRHTVINKLLESTQTWLSLKSSNQKPLRQSLIDLAYIWLRPDYFIKQMDKSPENKFSINLPQQVELATYYNTQKSIVDFLNRLKSKKLDGGQHKQIAELLTVITYNLISLYRSCEYESKEGFALALCHALATFSLKSRKDSAPAEVQEVYTKKLIPYFITFNTLTGVPDEEHFKDLLIAYASTHLSNRRM